MVACGLAGTFVTEFARTHELPDVNAASLVEASGSSKLQVRVVSALTTYLGMTPRHAAGTSSNRRIVL